MSTHKPRASLSDAARERAREYARAWEKRKRERKKGSTAVNHYVFARTRNVRDAEALERLAEIPKDTRTLTQRIFGDPLPTRSALARRERPT